MSEDKIEEIRARHAQSDNNFIEYESTWDIHADRAFLLAEDARHCAENEKLRAEIERLRAELDVELLRLAACNVVAMADTPESAIEARKMKPEYRSAALIRVERRVDEVIALRAEIERLRANLRECACACSSIRECESNWAKDNYCLHLNARNALEGKP